MGKKSASDDLKEMGDVSSGMSSRIIQLYLKDILNCFLKREYNVRLWAMKVADVVLKQGLVHPVQIVPYLICLSTDSSKEIAHYADFHLQDIDRNHSGFINMKTYAGIQLTFELQTTLQLDTNNIKIVRGFRINSKEEPPSSLNGFLYSLLRNTKPQRCALIQSITKQFDDQRTSLRQMLYLGDNLAYFPYLVQDEPLYIIHQIDVLISVTGTNLLSNFRDGLKAVVNTPGENQLETNPLNEDDDDDPDALYGRLPEDTVELENCIRAAQGCMLLLILKQHLKDCYGLTDGKISQYSPSEAGKTYEKQMQRRSVPIFKPQATIHVIEEEEKNADTNMNEDKKRELITRYLDFKQLMLKLDPEDPDAEEDDSPKKQNPANPDSAIANATKETNTNDRAAGAMKNDSNEQQHINNINSIQTSAPPIPQPQTPVQQNTNKKDFTPTVVRSTRNQQNKSVIKSASAKKSDSSSKKRRRRRLYSSASDESDSDPDYE